MLNISIFRWAVPDACKNSISSVNLSNKVDVDRNIFLIIQLGHENAKDKP